MLSDTELMQVLVECVAETLSVDPAEVTPDALLSADLAPSRSTTWTFPSAWKSASGSRCSSTRPCRPNNSSSMYRAA